MNTLKKILFGILAILVLVLIIAWFLPREIDVTVSQSVKAPVNYSYNFLNDLTNISQWDPWGDEDATIKMTMGDKTIGEGASYSWQSEKSGKGLLKVISSKKNEEIVSSLNFDGAQGNTGTYRFRPDGEGSVIDWNFKAKSSWPMNIMNFMFSGMFKKMASKGLKNIKKIVEQRYSDGKYNGYTVVLKDEPSKNYVISRSEIPMGKMQQFFTQNLGSLFQKIQKAGVEMNGKPSGLIYKYDLANDMVDMAAAIPISEEVAISDASSQYIEGGKAAEIDYYGDVSKIKLAHAAMDAFFRDREIFPKYPIVEEYVTDPSEEKDPEKWLTKVIYFIAE